MTITRLQIKIPMDTNVPADAVVNTWHFDVDTVDAAGYAPILTAMNTFYNAWQSERSTLATWPSATYKVYNMEDSEPRVPAISGTMSFSTTAGTGVLPPEVAVCLSYQALPLSGTNQQRRRGRIYLGPIASTVLSSSTGLLTTTAKSAFALAGDGLLAASQAATTWNWGVLSLASGSLVFAGTNNGWVDDAPDIQRRRGVLATTRSVFS